MTLFDSPAFEGHEGVHAFFDEKSGLKCIIAVHSTARGPAAGGCRMWPYPDADAALEDALRLSRAMSYKNAMADLELGGGKAVIIGDSRTQKTPALFEAFGRAVEDVGRQLLDRRGRRRLARRPDARAQAHPLCRRPRRPPGASGDPSPVTAEGVFRGIELGVRARANRDLTGVTVAIQGVGHVGAYLADKLHAAGAKLIITDVNAGCAATRSPRATGAKVVAPDAIFDADAEVFAPCALGGAINADTLPRLKAKVIAGGANNQLADPEIGRALFERGMLYAARLRHQRRRHHQCGRRDPRARPRRGLRPGLGGRQARRLMETLGEVLDRSADERRPTNEVANEMAKARISR